MHPSITSSPAIRSRARGTVIAVICLTAAGLLAALPTVPAQAAPQAAPNLQAPVALSGVPGGRLEPLLAKLPLGELDPAEVGRAIAGLPGLGALPEAKLEKAVAKLVEGLAGEGKALETLLTPADVVSGLKADLEGLLKPLELVELLGSLGKGESISTLLDSALGSLTAGELVGTLLENSAEPEKLIGELLGDLNAGELEGLLGSPLGSASFVPSSVGALAGEIGMTSEALAEELGIAPLSMPPVSLALTGALPNGTTLGVLDGLEGIDLGLFARAHEQGGGEGGGSGEGSSGGSGGSGGSGAGSSGGSGGAGGSGSSAPAGGETGSAGSTTVVVSYPEAGSPAPVAGAAAASAASKIKILSHRVERGVATIVVQVPTAGRVTLAGAGVRTVHAQARKRGRLTLRTRLTKAFRARHGRAHTTRVRLTAALAEALGPRSQASVTVRFGR